MNPSATLQVLPNPTKQCSKCKQVKPLTEFAINSAKSNGLRSECRICNRELGKKHYYAHRLKRIAKTRRWLAKNPERAKQISFKSRCKKFGLTPEEYNRLCAAQNGVCAICHQKELSVVGKRLAIDHNHITGKIRGLLCQRCNHFIGLAAEDITRLTEAIAYLVKFQ